MVGKLPTRRNFGLQGGSIGGRGGVRWRYVVASGRAGGRPRVECAVDGDRSQVTTPGPPRPGLQVALKEATACAAAALHFDLALYLP